MTRALADARLVLANSAGTEAAGARARRGAHARRAPRHGRPAASPRREPTLPTIATVGHLVARKRHADLLRALWLLRDSHPDLRWVVVGDGPERAGARAARDASSKLGGRVTLRGQLAARRRRAPRPRRRRCSRSRASTRRSGSPTSRRWRPGCRRSAAAARPGRRRSPRAGRGSGSSPPGDPEALAAELRTLLDDAAWRRELGDGARATVERAFTWEACGRATVAAYEEALR